MPIFRLISTMIPMNTPAGDISLRSLQVIHSAIVGGVAFLLLTIFLIMNTGDAASHDPSLGKFFPILVYASLLMVPLSMLLFRRKIASLEGKAPEEKLRAYKEAAVLRNALIETPALLGIVGYFLTGLNMLLLIALLILLILVYFFPTRVRVCNELGIEDRLLK